MYCIGTEVAPVPQTKIGCLTPSLPNSFGPDAAAALNAPSPILVSGAATAGERGDHHHKCIAQLVRHRYTSSKTDPLPPLPRCTESILSRSRQDCYEGGGVERGGRLVEWP